MNDQIVGPVPVWTLATSECVAVPALVGDAEMTPQRLAELRTALAAFSSVPVVTLEAHPLRKASPRSAGLVLGSASPLAQELSRLTSSSSKAPVVASATQTGETLFRMVVPQKVAEQFGRGAVRSMTSKAATGGVYDNLVDTAHQTVAKATFVPVHTAAATGAAGTAAGTAVAGTALTVAAPLVLMAVAVGASAYADSQRQKAIEGISELLEKLADDRLDRERNELDGCRDAIDKATGLLLDRGKVGASLGLDSAVHAISTAMRSADRRVTKWEAALDRLAGDAVDLGELETSFPGSIEGAGEFHAHLELAALALALKRRVIVLQAVEAGQNEADNLFGNFAQSLREDQQRIDQLESRVGWVLLRLSTLELRPPRRVVDRVMTRKQVENLLDASYRLRALGEGVLAAAPADIVIEIEQSSDGKLLVLPARTA